MSGRGRNQGRGRGNGRPTFSRNNRGPRVPASSVSSAVRNFGTQNNRSRGQYNRGRGAPGRGAYQGTSSRGSYYSQPTVATVRPMMVREAPAVSTFDYNSLNLSKPAPLLPAMKINLTKPGSWANQMLGEAPYIPLTTSAAVPAPLPSNIPSNAAAKNAPGEGTRVSRNGVNYILSATPSALNDPSNTGSFKDWRIIMGDQSIFERAIKYTSQGHKLVYTKKPIYAVTEEGERIAYSGIWLPYIYVDTVPYSFREYSELMEDQAKFAASKKEVYDRQQLEQWKGAKTEEEKLAVWQAREEKRKAESVKRGKEYKQTPFDPTGKPFSTECLFAMLQQKDGGEPICYNHTLQMITRKLNDLVDEFDFVRQVVNNISGKTERSAENTEKIAKYRERLDFINDQITSLDIFETRIMNEMEEKEKEIGICHAFHPGQEDVCYADPDTTIRGNISMYPNASEFTMPRGAVYGLAKQGGAKKGRKTAKKGREGKKYTRKH